MTNKCPNGQVLRKFARCSLYIS